jgi:MSHA biogenesis protein MshJ
MLENYSLRERIEILIAAIILIIIGWYFLIYETQMKWIAEKNQNIEKLRLEEKEAIKQRQVILTLASSESIKKLEIAYKNLQYQISRLDEKQAKYQLKYINEKEISEILFSMLKNFQGVSIDKLTSLEPEIKKIPPPPVAQPANKAAQNLPPPPIVTEIKDEQSHYLLQLRGNYFPILLYLRSLEQLKWQLYWDKMNYTVTTYPQAIVNIEFYTLSRSKRITVLGKTL